MKDLTEGKMVDFSKLIIRKLRNHGYCELHYSMFALSWPAHYLCMLWICRNVKHLLYHICHDTYIFTTGYAQTCGKRVCKELYYCNASWEMLQKSIKSIQKGCYERTCT